MSLPRLSFVNPAGCLCLLAVTTIVVPLRATTAVMNLDGTAPQETREEREERMRKPLVFAPQRMVVEALHEDVPMGNPIELAVTLAPGKVVNFDVLQRDRTGPLAQTHGAFKLLRTEGLTKTIEIVPMQLGSIDVEIGAVYSDNVVAQRTTHLHVIPSAKGLQSFWINGRSRTMSLVQGDLRHDRQLLQPGVIYNGIKYPIQLGDCQDFKVAVIPLDDATPAVTTDKFCIVHAIHPGKAYLVGDFDGVKDRVLVTVYDQDNAPIRMMKEKSR